MPGTHHSNSENDSAGNQSASGAHPHPSMKRVWRRARGYLKARAWFHSVACSRPIGAGDPTQDASGERRRGEERGGSADGKVSRARLTRRQGYRPASVCPGALGDERFTERGTLRYDEIYFWSAIVL